MSVSDSYSAEQFLCEILGMALLFIFMEEFYDF